MARIREEWKTFEKNVVDWMRTYESETLVLKNGYQAIPGYPSDGFRGDVSLTDGKTLIAIEIELKQSHPDTNVGKY